MYIMYNIIYSSKSDRREDLLVASHLRASQLDADGAHKYHESQNDNHEPSRLQPLRHRRLHHRHEHDHQDDETYTRTDLQRFFAHRPHVELM